MNKNYSIEDKTLILKINKQIYSKDIIIQTTYVLLDKYYFLLDIEDNYWKLIIELKDSNKNISEKDVKIILDELIESSSYLDQLKRTSKLRETILEKAVLSQTISDDLLELETENFKNDIE